MALTKKLAVSGLLIGAGMMITGDIARRRAGTKWILDRRHPAWITYTAVLGTILFCGSAAVYMNLESVRYPF